MIDAIRKFYRVMMIVVWASIFIWPAQAYPELDPNIQAAFEAEKSAVINEVINDVAFRDWLQEVIVGQSQAYDYLSPAEISVLIDFAIEANLKYLEGAVASADIKKNCGAWSVAGCWDPEKEQLFINMKVVTKGVNVQDPIYENVLRRVLVHELIHPVSGSLGFSDSNMEHCFTWGTFNGQSDGNYGICPMQEKEIVTLALDQLGDIPGWEEQVKWLLEDSLNSADMDGDGISNEFEKAQGTDPLSADSDGDGYSDSVDGCPKNRLDHVNSDTDLLCDNEDPCPTETDCDHDGRKDHNDKFPKDPNEWDDFDNDGIGDNTEMEMGTDPEHNDTDGDGELDDVDANPLYPSGGSDIDKDGIEDDVDPDMDGDGYMNAYEDEIGTDPQNPDTDGDWVNDSLDYNPLDPEDENDNDLDGLGNNMELKIGTDPDNPDTDGDGVADGDDVSIDDDDDGISNVIDNCSDAFNPEQENADNDYWGDVCDDNDDNDDYLDEDDCAPMNKKIPAKDEICGNGIDDDCDQKVDENVCDTYGGGIPAQCSYEMECHEELYAGEADSFCGDLWMKWLDCTKDNLSSTCQQYHEKYLDCLENSKHFHDTCSKYAEENPKCFMKLMSMDLDDVNKVHECCGWSYEHFMNGATSCPEEKIASYTGYEGKQWESCLKATTGDYDEPYPIQAVYCCQDAFGGGNSADTDKDGYSNGEEIMNGTDPNQFNEGAANLDSDSDSVKDIADNCVWVGNSNQEDYDKDGMGDACDNDIDNDGVANEKDVFIFDALEWMDTDFDGIGDNVDKDKDGDGVTNEKDAYPLNASKTIAEEGASGDTDGDGMANDSDNDIDGDGKTNDVDTDDDGDGVIDLNDVFPNDHTESKDTDKDGVGDNSDAFKNDKKEWKDSDGDGYGDNNADKFPNDPTEWKDTDGDGYGDNKADKFKNNAKEWADSDGDKVGDNSDAFKNDPTETKDSDSDGYGDNKDVFDNDPTEWLDTDKDGVGDNGDAFKNDKKEWKDSDGDGYGDKKDAFDFDPTEWLDTDKDGVGDNEDAFDNDKKEWKDSDGDGYGDNKDAFDNDPTEWLDTDKDGVGDKKDQYPKDPKKTGDVDLDGIDSKVDNCISVANADQKDADGDKQGDACDGDIDNDGYDNAADCGPAIKGINPGMKEACGNTTDDNCDGQINEICAEDQDGDGICDGTVPKKDLCMAGPDNCKYIPNFDQSDSDNNNSGDICEEYKDLVLPLPASNGGDGCYNTLCKNACSAGFICIEGRCTIDSKFVKFADLYHPCCLNKQPGSACKDQRRWKTLYGCLDSDGDGAMDQTDVAPDDPTKAALETHPCDDAKYACDSKIDSMVKKIDAACKLSNKLHAACKKAVTSFDYSGCRYECTLDLSKLSACDEMVKKNPNCGKLLDEIKGPVARCNIVINTCNKIDKGAYSQKTYCEKYKFIGNTDESYLTVKSDWDEDGVPDHKDNCPCIPNSDQDPASLLSKFCNAYDMCKDLAVYTEGGLRCNGNTCDDKAMLCAPGMRCTSGYCQPYANYGWEILGDLYGFCCAEVSDSACTDGKIWKSQADIPSFVEGGEAASEAGGTQPVPEGSEPDDAGQAGASAQTQQQGVSGQGFVAMSDWDKDGVPDSTDICPFIPNSDQDPSSKIMMICKAEHTNKDMKNYVDAVAGCIDDECDETDMPCAPGMRCTNSKCQSWDNYGWQYVDKIYHFCCRVADDVECPNGMIWKPQYQFVTGHDCSNNDDCADKLKCVNKLCAVEPKPSGEGTDDIDGDGILNDSDDDMDGDGLLNVVETEADDAHKSNPAKSDTDGDGVGDKEDNCRQDYNSDQKDTDKDALGDACDSDDDNDNVVDMWEMYYGCNPADKSSWPSIKDTCKYCDRYPCGESYIIWSEEDMDQDGMLNATDGDLDGDDIPNDQDDDMDGDGIPNANDNCIYSYNPDQADTDEFLNSFGNQSGDACDDDDDNDFISDKDEINGGCDPKNAMSQPKYPGTCSGIKSQ